MATEVLHISVSDDGSARVVARNLENLGKSGQRAQSSVDFLKKALVGIGAVATIRQLAAMSDSFTQMINTLRPGADSLGKTKTLLSQIAEVAARSNSDLGLAVNAFDSLSDATERLGVSNQRLLPITETALKLFQLGGQSADQAGSSVAALGAALASNDFSRTINSMLRSNLDFANAVAKGFGTSAEVLRQWAKDGRLTTESFLAAMEKIKGETDSTFGLLGTTISAATREAGDAIGLLVGQFFSTTGAGKDVAGVFKTVAAEIRQLAGDTTRMEAIARPFVGILKQMVELGGSLQRVSFTFGGDPKALGLGGVASKDITERLEKLREMKRISETPVDRLGLWERLLHGQLGASKTTSLDRIKSDIASLESEQARRFLANAKPPPGFVAPQAAPPPGPTGGGVDPASLLAPGRASAAEQAQALRDQAQAAQTAAEGFARLRAEQDPLIAAGQRYAEGLKVVNDALTLGLTTQGEAAAAVKGLTTELASARTESSRAAIEGFEALRAELDPAVAIGQKYASTIQAINAALAANPSLGAEAARLVGLATDQQKKALDQLHGSKPLMDSIAMSFDSALESLVNFTNTGQANIGEFASSVVSDLQKIVVKMFLVRALTSLAGAAGGGSTGLGGFLTQVASGIAGTRADGGPVSAGRTYMVGERGPELFTPPTRGSIVPNQALGGGANVTVVNVGDASEIPAAMATRAGEEVILNAIQRNAGRLRPILS